MARTLIERGFDPERIVKIYNGMDFDRPEGEFDRVAYLRDTYGAKIEDGDVLCGIAARLTAVKDIATTGSGGDAGGRGDLARRTDRDDSDPRRRFVPDGFR